MQKYYNLITLHSIVNTFISPWNLLTIKQWSGPFDWRRGIRMRAINSERDLKPPMETLQGLGCTLITIV